MVLKTLAPLYTTCDQLNHGMGNGHSEQRQIARQQQITDGNSVEVHKVDFNYNSPQRNLANALEPTFDGSFIQVSVKGGSLSFAGFKNFDKRTLNQMLFEKLPQT